MSKSWRPSDVVRGVGEPHEYSELETFRDDHWRRIDERRYRLEHPGARARMIRKTLSVETQMRWQCPSCGTSNLFVVVSDPEDYASEYARRHSCICGSIIYMTIKTPTIKVYSETKVESDAGS